MFHPISLYIRASIPNTRIRELSSLKRLRMGEILFMTAVIIESDRIIPSINFHT
ncbi:MAG: hypothetical protein U9N43_05390 [Euryarchaeota archaeon]|nr:hypothetical protein [Euryarchaeota archaeon]